MKKTIIRLSAFIWILYIVATPALAARELIPVGQVIGLELCDGSVTVAGFAGDSPAKAAGLQESDRILTVDGKRVCSAEDVRSALNQSKGSVALTVRRGKSEKNIRISPTITADGPKLGVYLKEGVTGIGTVTFYDPATGTFGALGHGVNSPEGKLLDMTSGTVYRARVASVRRGRTGEPGQLVGSVTDTAPAGSLSKNTARGVFGSISQVSSGDALPIAKRSQIKPGSAAILSTVNGNTPREYSVEIVKIYASGSGERNMLIRVTDPDLLKTTGGIVQGMSGSPIIQDGKLVGAVTHVLVNDPTTGYGIFIENMLDAAA